MVHINKAEVKTIERDWLS